jgi:hypothetical protein
MMQEDWAAFFNPAEFCVLAAFNGEVISLLLDAADQDIFGGGQQSTEYTAQYPTGAWLGIKNGNEISIDAVPYRVREVMKIEDGKITKLTLEKL